MLTKYMHFKQQNPIYKSTPDETRQNPDHSWQINTAIELSALYVFGSLIVRAPIHRNYATNSCSSPTHRLDHFLLLVQIYEFRVCGSTTSAHWMNTITKTKIIKHQQNHMCCPKPFFFLHLSFETLVSVNTPFNLLGNTFNSSDVILKKPTS